jgi:hypothetical protein
MPEPLSAGFKKLLREPAYCQLATLMADGSPQITQVWVDTDGEHILVNTAQGRQKVINIRRDPRVAVNVVDPDNAWRLWPWFADGWWRSPPRAPTGSSTSWPRSTSMRIPTHFGTPRRYA